MKRAFIPLSARSRGLQSDPSVDPREHDNVLLKLCQLRGRCVITPPLRGAYQVTLGHHSYSQKGGLIFSLTLILLLC